MTVSRLFGYARVSSDTQDCTIQIEALKAAGVNEALIFSEKRSGTTTEGRVELARCLALMSPGDVLVTMRLDRLMRNMKDYVGIIDQLKSKGCGLRCTHEPIDASGPMGMLVMDILAAVAAFETGRRRERQLEGIAQAKREGRYTGGKVRIDPADVRRLTDEGKGPSEVADLLKCSRQSIYRILDDIAA